ncbi:MAG: hypothetical protein LBE83_02665, partial [Propionibacteriaceae bacterium]|nr:hypothetical protein [Propionibacteriaceae bacterium]
MAEVDYAKFWHWLGAPLRLWKSSLTLRVVTSSMLGSLLVLLGSGVFLLYQVTEGIATNAREAAISEARQAMLVIEAQ